MKDVKKNNQKGIIVAIDVGTTKVCTLVGLKNQDEIEILGVGSHPSYGLKKGSVINIDKTVRSIRCSLEEAKLMAGISSLSSAAIGIAGNHIYSFNGFGVVGIKGSEVTEEDVERVIDAAKAVVIPSDREILHVIPQEFRVDTIEGIKDPLGMSGSRLEAHVHIVTGQTALIQNMVKCVHLAGVEAKNVILQPIASSRSVLSSEEKELGVALIDIGGGTTDMAVWKDGSLVHSQIIPVGGNHFTNDLAVALKVPHTEAERIKIHHGSVITEKVNESSHIMVEGVSGTGTREVALSLIAKVLGSRAEEIFNIINSIIETKNLDSEITGGFVITGGGALIKDLVPLGEFTLEKTVRIGYPHPFGGMTSVMKDPKFSTALGLILEAEALNDASEVEGKEKVIEEEKLPQEGQDIMTKFGESLKNVFKEIF